MEDLDFCRLQQTITAATITTVTRTGNAISNIVNSSLPISLFVFVLIVVFGVVVNETDVVINFFVGLLELVERGEEKGVDDVAIVDFSAVDVIVVDVCVCVVVCNDVV